MKGRLHKNPITLSTSQSLPHTLTQPTLIRCLPCPRKQIHMPSLAQSGVARARQVHSNKPAKHAPARTALLHQGSNCMRKYFLFVHDHVMTLDVRPCLVRRRFILRSSIGSFCIPFGPLGIIDLMTLYSIITSDHPSVHNAPFWHHVVFDFLLTTLPLFSSPQL